MVFGLSWKTLAIMQIIDNLGNLIILSNYVEPDGRGQGGGGATVTIGQIDYSCDSILSGLLV
jgi:hypothetical protein